MIRSSNELQATSDDASKQRQDLVDGGSLLRADMNDRPSSDTNEQHQQHLQLQDQDDSNSNSGKPKRNPFCSRCRNHGKKAQVKGHKRHCEYRYCQCEGCHLVEMRQIVSARQIKRRRNLKQDEECGRRIEVSPPVLTRKPDSDLATLIAKTLIGDSATKHLPLQVAAAAAYNKPDNDLHLPATSVYQQLQPNHQHQGVPTLQQTDPLNITHLSSQQHRPLTHRSPQQEQQSSSPVSSAMSNALHLFSFPNSVLSAAAAASFNTSQSSSIIIPPVIPSSSSAAAAAVATSPSLPSFREQLTLVEEIYNSFGPLAIFAWLKAEQFNFKKVHELIKTSQGSYNNLLDLKSKYNLNNNTKYDLQHQHIHTLALNGSGNCGIVNGGCTSSNTCVSDKKRQDTHRSSDSHSPGTCSRSSSSTNNNTSPTTSGTMITATTSNNNTTDRVINSSPSNAINCLNLLSTTISSTPSPLYTIGNSSSNNCFSSNSTNSSSSNNNNDRETTVNSAAAAAAAAAHHQHNMSLASTLGSLPMSTATRDILWPSLKMSTGNGTASTAPSIMHPHHFLPHFMHHPFGAHQHHYFQQVSPAQLSTITNLSSSSAASSSSTVL